MAERINAVKTSFFGKGAIRLLGPELQKMGIRRALLVTDRFLYDSGAAGVEAAFFVDGDLRSALGGGKSGGGRNPGGNAADDNNFHCLSLTIPPGGSPSLRQNLQGVTYSGWEDCPRCPR